MTNLLRLVAGAALLILGRKLFWLFIAAIGFESGAYLATRLFHGGSELIVLLIALVAGLVGALLAVFLENIVIAAAGFLAGGYLLVNLLELLRLNPGRLDWLVYLVGGVIGALVAALVVDWALIFLSSLSGAVIVTRAALPFGHPLEFIVIVVLFVIGVVIQFGIWQAEQPNAT